MVPLTHMTTTTNGLYVIQFISEAYKLQNNTKIDRQVIFSGELVVKAQYISSIQENANSYWKQQSLKHTIIIPTHKIIHRRLNIVIIRYDQYIPKNVCNRIQAKKDMQRNSIFMTDFDYDNISDEIERQENFSLNGL